MFCLDLDYSLDLFPEITYKQIIGADKVMYNKIIIREIVGKWFGLLS